MIAYAAPDSLHDALDLLERHKDEAKVLAGGQSLLVLLRQGLVAPSVLVSLRNIQELRQLSFSLAEGCQIGASVTQVVLEHDSNVRTFYAALAEAASVVATRQVRNRGTLGGNLCHADPTADPPAALIALGAVLEIIGPGGARRVETHDFFRDFMEVDLEPYEVLARVLLPVPVPRSGSAYLKHRLREVDTALVGVAVWVQTDAKGQTITDARVGLAGCGATPLRSWAAEDVLRGAWIAPEMLERAGAAASEACDPLSDTEASGWYRRHMVHEFVKRVAARALERAFDSGRVA